MHRRRTRLFRASLLPSRTHIKASSRVIKQCIMLGDAISHTNHHVSHRTNLTRKNTCWINTGANLHEHPIGEAQHTHMPHKQTAPAYAITESREPLVHATTTTPRKHLLAAGHSPHFFLCSSFLAARVVAA